MSQSKASGKRLYETVNSVLSPEGNSYSDHVFKNREGATLNTCIRLCRADEIDVITDLQTRVYDSIGNKNTFVLTTGEELSESLSLDVCLGVYDGVKLIAFTLMVVNRNTSRNLGYSLGYDESKCLKCVTNDTTFTDLDYQGYGVQRHLLEIKHAIASKLGAEEMLATVSPENHVSLRNLMSEGLRLLPINLCTAAIGDLS